MRSGSEIMIFNAAMAAATLAGLILALKISGRELCFR